MTRLAIAGEEGFEVSLVDAPHPDGTPNYSLETLLALRASLPQNGALFCLMGADAFLGLRSWHRAAEIPFVAALVVASRPGQDLEGLRSALPAGLAIESFPHSTHAEIKLPAGRKHSGLDRPRIEAYLLRNSTGESAPFFILPELEVEISASQVREVIQSQFSDSPATPLPELGLLPHAVLDYIRNHGRYR